MPKWLNFVHVAAPRNGLTTHAVDPSSATNAIAGTPFAPTAGRLLVVVVNGAVSSTTPAGWTLPPNGDALQNTGLYVWTKTATGGDTFSTTHNASNAPASFLIFEFASGATFAGVVKAINQTATAANPALAGLTGITQVFAAAAWSDNVTGGTTGSATWNSPNVELVDYNDLGSDAYWLGLVYQEDYASSSYAPTPTITAPDAGTSERLTFAIAVPTGTTYSRTSTIIVGP